jgi:hypothetical protein
MAQFERVAPKYVLCDKAFDAQKLQTVAQQNVDWWMDVAHRPNLPVTRCFNGTIDDEFYSIELFGLVRCNNGIFTNKLYEILRTCTCDRTPDQAQLAAANINDLIY